MKKFSLYAFLLFFCFSANAQITVPITTLPEVGDVLQTTRFDYELESTSFKMQGENLSWSYDDFVVTGPAEEGYLDITGTDLADMFPQANMIVELAGFQAAAVRTDNTIEVVGLGTLDFMDVEIDGGVNFDDSYLLEKRPISYGDFFEDDFDITIQIAAEVLPFLDSIEIPLPGATLDSIRINVITYKSEEATAWGTLDVLGTSYDVLKVEQFDTSALKIEAGLGILGNVVWLDASAFLGDMIPAIPNRTTHKFLDASSKMPIVEFTDVSFEDPDTGEFMERVTGRMSAEILSSNKDITVYSEDLLVFPNPVSDQLQMQLDPEAGDIQQIVLYTLNGAQVINTTAANGEISVKHLLAGQYFLKVVTEDKIFVKQIQIVK